MSAVKDLVDLVTQLDASRFDSRTRDAVLPIKEAALELQREVFRSERQHAEEMDKLKAEYREAMNRLQSENAALRAQQYPTPESKFLPEIGAWFDASSGIHYCPRCWGKKQVSPMADTGSGWVCPVCLCGAMKPSVEPECPTVISGPNIIDRIDPERRHFPKL